MWLSPIIVLHLLLFQVNDVQLLASQQFKAKSSELASMTAMALCNGDCKEFSFKTTTFEGSVGFAVVETTDDEVILSRTEELLIALVEERQAKMLDVIFLAVVNIVELRTTLLMCGEGERSLATIAFSSCQVKSDSEPFVMDLGGLVSRKKDFIPAVKKGLEEAVLNGVVGGYPVIDVNIDIIDGSFHEVDSNEMAFKMAGIFAFKEAMKDAKPILLEPIMKVENLTPEEYQGDILGDLNRRRGRIQNLEAKGNLSAVHAEVPLAEMFGYSTAIRSLSRGRSSYSMEPSHFEQVPASVLAAVLDQKGS